MPSRLYIAVHEAEHNRHIITDKKLLERQAKTDEPYRNIFKIPELPRIAAAAIIRIPVPKKNEEIIEIQKCFLKIIFKNTYKLAQPKLIIIFPRMAQISEPKLTENESPTSAPASIVPIRYVIHIAAIANAHIIDLLII